jgi:hypothetical protein
VRVRDWCGVGLKGTKGWKCAIPYRVGVKVFNQATMSLSST